MRRLLPEAGPRRQAALAGRGTGPAALRPDELGPDLPAPGVRIVAERHAPRDSAVRRLLAVADLTAVGAAFVFTALLTTADAADLLWALPTLPLWIVVFKTYGLYDRDAKRISNETVDDLPWIAHAVLVGSLLTLVYFHLTPVRELTLSDLALFAGSALLATCFARATVRRLSCVVLGPERLLLVGGGASLETLARKLASHAEYGVEAIGIVGRAPEAEPIAGLPVLGCLAELDLEELVERYSVERLVLAHKDFEEGELFDLLHRCRELNVKISLLPQLFDALGPSVELDDVEGVTVLGLNPAVLPRSSRLLKRTIDLVGAVTLLAVTAPLQLAIALAIKLTSPGPVFFGQVRIGRRGRCFRLFKFRTMVIDAEERRAELLAASKDPNWLLIDHDPRITRVGGFLRKYSLDELPQLWNVLRGEMSLVGPRPIIEDEDRQLQGWRRSRIDLTPGITGLWQVLGRTNIPFDEMIKLDYLYVTNWSLWTDLGLVLRTVPVILLRKGAN
jgi:exopolysaccharide biosynthesis polyprenyl glycosylphosphotransferase